MSGLFPILRRQATVMLLQVAILVPRWTMSPALRKGQLSTCEQFAHHHSVKSSSHSVNGDIAIQWEWSNFDHS